MLNLSFHNRDPGIAKFTLLIVSFNIDKATWKTSSSFFGEECFTSHYWKWVEDILGKYKEVLTRTGKFELSTRQGSPTIVVRIFYELSSNTSVLR